MPAPIYSKRYPPHNGTIRPGIKKVAQKVMGGVKAIGKLAVKPIKYIGKQIEKEWRGEDDEIEDFRKKQKDRGNI